ncbi:MAG: FxDxF family PEP-CTERM protein [Aquabacterium sp.]
MQIKHLLGVSTLALACQAGAAVTNWGAHDELEKAVGTVQPGSFTDIISFTLNNDAPLAVSIVANNLGPKLDIIGGTISLYEQTGGGLSVELGSYEFTGATGDTTRLFTPSGPGDYLYAIKGYATGTEGGWYTVASTALPVPEPKPMTMALSALAIVGLMYHRKRQH